MVGRVHINFLEFLAAPIGLWIDISTSPNPHQPYLCLTDSSSALGWLYKSNFNPESHIEHDAVARNLADLMLTSETTLYSQHIRGSQNIIADCLSRDFRLSDKHLTFLLNGLFPSQAKAPLLILSNLPDEITSFVNSLDHFLIKRPVSQSPREPSSLGALFAGKLSWRDVTSKMSSSTALDRTNVSSCCPLLQRVSDTMKEANQNAQKLHGTTVRSTLSNICSNFRSHARQNPILESGGEKALVVKRQIQGYINDDPVQQHQKCLPIGVFRRLWSNTASPLTSDIGQLTTGALFFGMRSC